MRRLLGAVSLRSVNPSRPWPAAALRRHVWLMRRLLGAVSLRSVNPFVLLHN
jgi:hypothetical protein